MTRDLIENPIFIVQTGEYVYKEYLTKTCILTNTEWFEKRHDMFADETNRWCVWDRIHITSQIYNGIELNTTMIGIIITEF